MGRLALLIFAVLATAQAMDWESRGRMDLAAGKLRSAKDAFRRAVAESENRPREQAVALASLGQTMLALGEWSNALIVLQKALDLEPEAAETWHLFGQALYKTGDQGGAEKAIRKALTLAETKPAIQAACLSDLATLFGDGRGEDAVEMLRMALDTMPAGQGRARMLANLGILRFEAGRKTQAARLLAAALEEMEAAVGTHHPDVAFILENYSVVLRKTGRKVEARQAASRANELQRSLSWQAGTNGAVVDWHDLRAKADGGR